MTNKNIKMTKRKTTKRKIKSHFNSILNKNEYAWQIYNGYIHKENPIESATNIFLAILEEKPNYLPSLLEIGNIYYDQKKFKKALEYYEKFTKISIKIDSERKNIYFINEIRNILLKIGIIYENINQYDKANKIFKNLSLKKKVGKFDNDPIDLAKDRLNAHEQLNKIGLKIGI